MFLLPVLSLLYYILFIKVFKTLVLFDLIGNMSLDQLLDQQPTILELTTYAETAKWNKLGVKLELNNMDLAGCQDCTSMYQLWIEEKAKGATRRSLLAALSAIRLNDIARKYREYLETMVSYIVHISLYTCA